jgi:hypothetical protein
MKTIQSLIILGLISSLVIGCNGKSTKVEVQNQSTSVSAQSSSDRYWENKNKERAEQDQPLIDAMHQRFKDQRTAINSSNYTAKDKMTIIKLIDKVVDDAPNYSNGGSENLILPSYEEAW